MLCGYVCTQVWYAMQVSVRNAMYAMRDGQAGRSADAGVCAMQICAMLSGTQIALKSRQIVAKMWLRGLKIGVLWTYYMTGFESVL